MKRNRLLIAIMLTGVVIHANDASEYCSQDWIDLRKEIVLLRRSLTGKGVKEFLAMPTLPAVAPYIHSKSWVDWLPKEEVERRAYEQEKRDFGLEMIGQLESLSSEKIEVTDVVGLRARAELLLRIAAWMRSSSGYGNYVIKQQAERQALTDISGMAVSDDCSVSEARLLLNRVDSPAKSSVMQVAILNEESPHKYKQPSATKGSEIQLALGRQWGEHRRNAVRYFGSRFPDNGRLTFDMVKSDEREYAFYIPDRNLGDASIRRYWDQKDHEEVCIYGMYSNKRDKIEWILKFREVIGSIPKPGKMDLVSEEAQEHYVGKVNDLWFRKGCPDSVKPIGRIVMWIYQGLMM